MFLDEDLRIWTAYKRIWILASPLILIWAFCFYTYLWIFAFNQISFPVVVSVPANNGMNSTGLSPFIVNLSSNILFIGAKIQSLFGTYSFNLLTINPTLQLLLLAGVFGAGPIFMVIGTYNWVLLRLSKETTFGNLMFSFDFWNLPDSERYKNYGEAKARIKHLIRKGTLKEKSAIFVFGICYFGFFLYLIIILLSLSGILSPVLFQSNAFIMFPFLLALILSQRFMWNTIK